MKRIAFMLTFLSAAALFHSCDKSTSGADPEAVFYSEVNQEFVLIRDVEQLQNSTDEISMHIDSIISGLINEEFISTGLKSFDLDNDGDPDIRFEIADLNKFNPNGLPDSFDSLAARALPVSVQILDNSTHHYPDALNAGALISGEGHWTDGNCVLGTFMNAGQFQGMGEKYLGFRFDQADAYRYGWIKLYCSQHNDTLRIVEYGYMLNEGKAIYAGQKE